METTALAMNGQAPQAVGAKIEQVLISGDLSRLTPEERVSYYNAVCESVGLNPLTKPFEYITLNNKLTLYARRDCTDQLRRRHHISISVVSRELVEDCYVVTARATDLGRDGRLDEAIGAVSISGLKGEARANAMMKAETKAKRRVTLSICGLGMLDETEAESIPGARVQPSAPTEYTPPLQQQAPAEPIASPAQVKALMAAMNDLGIKDRAERLSWVVARIGRKVESSKELTAAECSQCIDAAKAGVVDPTPTREPGGEG